MRLGPRSVKILCIELIRFRRLTSLCKAAKTPRLLGLKHPLLCIRTPHYFDRQHLYYGVGWNTENGFLAHTHPLPAIRF
ncbi:hypothetical protein AFLA_007926 [Aspergillus flavus NRRL3357]|nr:hypothetical protein AFLA_007926 [Aspergillus flavus NRRL3357]